MNAYIFMYNAAPNPDKGKKMEAFDDLDQLVLGQCYRAYLATGHPHQVNIGVFTIDFKHMIQFRNSDPSRQRQIFIIEPQKNHIRERPSQSQRFCQQVSSQEQQLEELEKTDYRWIDKQYREMVGWNFIKQNFTVHLIMTGVTKEAIVQRQKSFDPNESEESKQASQEATKKVFELMEKLIVDEDKLHKPIIMDDLRYHRNSEVVVSILFMYSMETFLPYTLNKASRDKDMSKVPTLGPFAYALAVIVWWRQSKRDGGETKIYTLYRGVKLSRSQLDEYKKGFWKKILKRPKFIHLTGFQSTSLKEHVALGFAFRNADPAQDKHVALYRIQFRSSFRHFCLDSDKYTLYPSENEILLLDGLEYEVVKITKIKDDNRPFPYTLIDLKLVLRL